MRFIFKDYLLLSIFHIRKIQILINISDSVSHSSYREYNPIKPVLKSDISYTVCFRRFFLQTQFAFQYIKV